MQHFRSMVKTSVVLASLFVTTACAGVGSQSAPPFPVVNLSDCGPAPSAGPLFLEPQLSQQLRLRTAGRMTYPEDLWARGVSGTVRLALVIDTLGRAVPSSLRILSSDNLGFEEPTRATVLQSRWFPGMAEGRLAAVCTILTFHFNPNSFRDMRT